jgi:tetratricopeptide (TPR) repeat protein
MRLGILNILLLLFLSCFALNAAHAQPSTDEQLAAQYFQNKEYDKAAVYFEKLFNKNPQQLYYTNYVTCLLEMKDFKKAEKFVKKQIKQNPDDLNYIVDLGTVYQASGDPSKAKDEYERAIKELSPDQNQVFTLAKAFIAIQEWDYAIDTYKKGRKFFRDTYPFSFELAEVYGKKGDTEAMINEYLDVLEINESYIQSVQNAMQNSFSVYADQKKNEMLKNELLKRIQKKPDYTIFSELLLWMLIQQKDFESAYVQAKALDKRKKEEGTRVMSIAQLAATNEAYDVSVKAYQYVISKGANSYYYINARMEMLDVMYKKIVSTNNYTLDDLIRLEISFKETLQELGKYAGTAPLIKKLAHLQAFYLHKTDEPIELLEEAIAMPQLSPTTQAECKLELGDVLLMTGDIWEASLTYSQVEKAFKHETIGQEAKFRTAKISYYNGDFEWAQAQLDVLKAATSKLIANDAMNLSLLITDNTAIDTNSVPLLMFAKAELLAFQNKDDLALRKLDSISLVFPDHALADDILFRKSHIMIKKGKYDEAVTLLEKIIDLYPGDILADDAIFRLAQLNDTKLNNPEKAMSLYEMLLEKYPGSLYTVEARKRYREMRGDIVN